MIELTQAWIKDSFTRTGLSAEFFPIYKAKMKECYAQLQADCPDDEDTSGEESNVFASIRLTDEYISYHAHEIEKGHSHTWAESYAADQALGECDATILRNALSAITNEEDRVREFNLHAKSISEDPVFIERYRYLFEQIADEPLEQALGYCKIYHELIGKGKSHDYAHAYADAVYEGYQAIFCEIQAQAYETAREHGMIEVEAWGFGDTCSTACDTGYWVSMRSFLKNFTEEWQKEFYLLLICEEYRREHKSEMPEWEIEETRKAIYQQ